MQVYRVELVNLPRCFESESESETLIVRMRTFLAKNEYSTRLKSLLNVRLCQLDNSQKITDKLSQVLRWQQVFRGAMLCALACINMID